MHNNSSLLGQITQKILNNQNNQTEKTVNQTATVGEQKKPEFIHPILTTKDFKETIKQYNLYVKKYNIEVWKLNAKVRDYNLKVKRFRKGLQQNMEAKVREEIWKKQHRSYPPKEYNKLVEKYNTNRDGWYLQKRNLREEVKKESEKVFIAILHQLNQQLYKRKQIRKRLGVHIAAEMPKVDIYPNKITTIERDGYTNLPVSKNTFRHHRERLEEARVLVDYEFKGSKRAVKMRINPEILTLTDNKTPKSTATENQSFNSVGTKKVVHDNVSSRTLSDKNKIRDERSLLPQTDNNCTGTSTGTPNKQDSEKNFSGENLKPVSEKLLSVLEDQTDVCKDLAAGDYNDYSPIFKKYIHEEALRGSMLQEDFKELAIQDILKFSARLFGKMEVHPGSWQNAYKYWLQDKFISPNGYVLSKPIIAERWEKSLKVLKEAYKYQKNNPEWDIRYPSIYFDTARTHKEESSFEYAYRFFRLEKKPAKSKKARKLEHLRNSRKHTDLKKAQKAARKYVQGQINLQSVFEYVEHNCNAEIFEQITEIIKKEFNKIHRQK
ncbi:hypothetical protein [Mesonia aquimarina]|uniref:hypothetical protein n=1 Tax=Mesonia aquimarina TaxID=1504967 RepID=UPI000EF5C27B|nr:hypothetical protein [Mesonia aquimarina]